MKGKSQKGMTMIIALIVIFIFTVLGAAIWQYGVNSVKASDKAYKQKQAYYIARSCVEAMSSHILNTSETSTVKSDIDKIIDKPSSPITIGDGTCILTLKRDGAKISIEGIGSFGGETATTTLEINENIDFGIPNHVFENVIFATGSITLNGNVDIIGGTLKAAGQIKVNGSSYPSDNHSSSTIYPTIIFPNNTSTTDLSVDENETTYISSDGYYDYIFVDTEGILQINLQGGDLTLVVNKLTVHGELKISGSGRLILFVKNLETKNNSGEINIANEALPIRSFLVLMPPDGQYSVNRFRGLLYAPGADIKIHGGPSFTGAMVVGNIVNSGNPVITYVQEANSIKPSDLDGIETTKTTTITYEKGKWK